MSCPPFLEFDDLLTNAVDKLEDLFNPNLILLDSNTFFSNQAKATFVWLR